jgi:hypothetical protein
MDRLFSLMDWKNNQLCSQVTVLSPLTTLSSPNAGCNTVIHREYLLTGPLGKKTFRNRLVQNLIDYCFQDCEPTFYVSEQLRYSLESCDTIANVSCPSDTSTSVSGNKASTFRVDSASDVALSARRGTETLYNKTNGVQ